MPNRAARRTYTALLLAGLSLLTTAGFAQSRRLEFKTSKKLPVRVLLNPAMPYVTAQLLVFYSQEPFSQMERAKANLTLINLFDRELGSAPDVQGHLERLGNDVRLEQRPDFLRITVNFLPDRINQFAALVNSLFSYHSFSVEKFNLSKEQYWIRLTRGRDWKMELALQLAYSHFFLSPTAAGGVVVGSDTLRRLSLVHIRSFHRRTFRPDNALLVIKGNINPYITLGLLEKAMQSNWPAQRPEPRPEPNLNPGQRFIILNTSSAEPPQLFFFDLLPAFDDDGFLPARVLAGLLFGFPGGRILRSNRSTLLSRNYQFNDDLFSCRPLPISSHSLRVQVEDLEDLLLLVESEKRKLALKPVDGKELLEALTTAVGRLQVRSADPDHEMRLEVDQFLAGQRRNPEAEPNALIERVNLERINRRIEESAAGRPRGNGADRGVIVIIGNAAEIMGRLGARRPDLIELIRN